MVREVGTPIIVNIIVKNDTNVVHYDDVVVVDVWLGNVDIVEGEIGGCGVGYKNESFGQQSREAIIGPEELEVR